MIEIENRFLEFLNYQIGSKDSFYGKLSRFYEDLSKLSYKISVKEKEVRKMYLKAPPQEVSRVVKQRTSYRSLVDEFKALVKRKNLLAK